MNSVKKYSYDQSLMKIIELIDNHVKSNKVDDLTLSTLKSLEEKLEHKLEVYKLLINGESNEKVQ